jgi:phage tail-like protein
MSFSASVATGSALISRPFATFQFFVEIGSVTEAAFQECSGLQSEMEVYEYKEGGLNTHVHRLPGRAKVSNVTLKRGIARPVTSRDGEWDNVLWKWYCKTIQGEIVRHTFSIILYDTNFSKRVATWDIIDAYPIKWIGPPLKAGEQAAAIESIELAHRGVMLL